MSIAQEVRKRMQAMKRRIEAARGVAPEAGATVKEVDSAGASPHLAATKKRKLWWEDKD